MANVKKKVQDELEDEILYEDVEDGDGHEPTLADKIAENRTYLFAGVGVIVLIVIGVLALKAMRSSKNQEANAVAFRSFQYFENDSLAKAISGTSEYPGLEGLADDYGSTDIGNLAKYQAGIAYLEQGNLDEGIAKLKSFSKGSNQVSVSAYMALGFAHEDKGEFDKAASYFLDASGVFDENDFTTPLCLLHAGRNYEAAGKYDKAVKYYTQIKEEFPLSTEARDIDKYLGRATAKAHGSGH